LRLAGLTDTAARTAPATEIVGGVVAHGHAVAHVDAPQVEQGVGLQAPAQVGFLSVLMACSLPRRGLAEVQAVGHQNAPVAIQGVVVLDVQGQAAVAPGVATAELAAPRPSSTKRRQSLGPALHRVRRRRGAGRPGRRPGRPGGWPPSAGLRPAGWAERSVGATSVARGLRSRAGL
jgi:hypothetical protein